MAVPGGDAGEVGSDRDGDGQRAAWIGALAQLGSRGAVPQLTVVVAAPAVPGSVGGAAAGVREAHTQRGEREAAGYGRGGGNARVPGARHKTGR